MAAAVPAWSPVIIFTVIPASWHAEIASMASWRGGSVIPARPKSSKPPSASASPISCISAAGFDAKASTRSPREDMRSTSSATASRSCVPHRSRTTVEAPFRYTRRPPSASPASPGASLSVAMYRSSDSKGTESTRRKRWRASSGPKPNFSAATTSAPSVGSPTTVRPSPPPSSIEASLHRSPASASSSTSFGVPPAGVPFGSRSSPSGS